MKKKIEKLEKSANVLAYIMFLPVLICIVAAFFVKSKITASIIAIASVICTFLFLVLFFVNLTKTNELKENFIKNNIKEKLQKDDFTEILFKPSCNTDIENFMCKVLDNTSNLTYFAKVKEDDKIEIVVMENNTKIILQDYEITNYYFFDIHFKIKDE